MIPSSSLTHTRSLQVIRWVMHYPYPMYCREYCYVRRAIIDRSKNLMILVSKSTTHPSCDSRPSNCVRVTDYDSRLVIRPHRGPRDNGFDYLLTYFDDPQSSFPSAAYAWMAYSGVPDFVDKLHAAAILLHQRMMQPQQQQQTNKPVGGDDQAAKAAATTPQQQQQSQRAATPISTHKGGSNSSSGSSGTSSRVTR